MWGRPRSIALVVAALAVGSAFASPAAAQSTDRVLAEALFREGRELMDQDKVSEACGKFQESYRLDRALGTLVNLALCHEKEGKTASAWAEFNEAAADAAADKDDREAFARRHIAALTPQLARLHLVVAPATAALESLEVRLDGHVVGRAAWSSPLPIDPGDHEIRTTAEGKRPYAMKFVVAKGPGTTNLAVPALEDGPKPITVAPPPAEPADAPGKTQRTLGYIAGGVGLAGLAVGGIFGLTAISLKGDRDARCGAGNVCDAEGVEKDGDARDAALVSTIGVIAGGVLLAGGVALVLTAPKASSSPRVQVGIAGQRVVLGGSF